jgi:uncharacterized membrane protein YoaK (UPF0700 family)
MQRARQSSESIELAVFLALSGGMMDAYSYLARGKVFANAQTGNMLLVGVNLADGNWGRAINYALPVLFFAGGIALAHLFKLRFHGTRLHWRQLSLLAEIALLCVVALMPPELDLLANSITSFACGIQVQSFRKLHGRAFATTMCIGNLRSGTQDLVTYLHTHERDRLEGACLYYGVIVCFVIGAIIGARLIGAFGLHAILASPALLAVACLVMFVDREKRRRLSALSW